MLSRQLELSDRREGGDQKIKEKRGSFHRPFDHLVLVEEGTLMGKSATLFNNVAVMLSADDISENTTPGKRAIFLASLLSRPGERKRRKAQAIILLVTVLVGFATVSNSWAQTLWQADPTTVGNWLDTVNWSAGVPSLFDDPTIDNGGTALISGGLAQGRNIMVGNSNSGFLEQIGGELEVQQLLLLGQGVGSSGSFSFGGTAVATIPSLVVGQFGMGDMTMTGGTLQIESNFVVGSSNVGSMLQTGGVLNATLGSQTDVIVGGFPGSSGSYEMTGASQIFADRLIVGEVGSGEFFHRGGSVEVEEDFHVGANGFYQLDDGTISARRLFVSSDTSTSIGGEQGGFIQNGGEIDVLFATVAEAIGGHGTYRMNDGTLLTSRLIIGFFGQGLFSQTGGRVDADMIEMRPDNLGTSAVYEMSGGELHTQSLRIGNFLDARFQQTEGDVNATSISFESFGVGESLYELAGGILHVATLDLTDGDFQFNGGTLDADVVIGDLQNEGGTVSPGPDASETEVFGSYDHLPAALLDIEIGGVGAGEFDTLAIQDSAALAGNLRVTLQAGFDPDPGNVFTILTASNIQGQFNNAPLTIAAGDAIFRVLYGDQSVALVMLVPEPSTFFLAVMAAIGLVAYRRWRRRA